jgi:hypothetical protein
LWIITTTNYWLSEQSRQKCPAYDPAHYKFDYIFRPNTNNKVSEMQATEIEKVHFKEVQDITKNENYVNPVSNFLIALKASETIIFRNYNQF